MYWDLPMRHADRAGGMAPRHRFQYPAFAVLLPLERVDRQGEEITDAAFGLDDPRHARIDL